MKRLHRRLLFFISTVVFLAMAPIVILYAMGYRSLATTVDPIPVGVVLLETFPRRADAVVNNDDVGKTPRAVPNIPAGDVHIKLTKEGYRDWEKTVAVKPGLATELRGIRLWLADRTPKIFARGAELLAISPNRQLVAVYFGNKTLQVFDKDGEALMAPVLLRRSPKGMLWAPDNATILLQNHDASNDVYSIGAARATVRRLPALQGMVKAAWDPRVPGRLFTQNQAGTIRIHNILTQASATIVTRATDFGLGGRSLFVATSAGKINQYNLQGILQRTLPVQLDGTVQLLVTPEERVAVHTNDKLFVIRDDALVEVGAALHTAWSPDGRTLMVQPDATSLYVYNEADERSPLAPHTLQLVVRLSRAIKSPQWFAGGAHLLYQVEDEVRVVEIDTRDHAIEETIDTTNLGESHAMVGEDGETLFYLKRVDGQTNLVVIPLVSSQ